MRLTPGVGDVSGGAEGGVGPVTVLLLPMLENYLSSLLTLWSMFIER